MTLLVLAAGWLIGLELVLTVTLFLACPLKVGGRARPALRVPVDRLRRRRRAIGRAVI